MFLTPSPIFVSEAVRFMVSHSFPEICSVVSHYHAWSSHTCVFSHVFFPRALFFLFFFILFLSFLRFSVSVFFLSDPGFRPFKHLYVVRFLYAGLQNPLLLRRVARWGKYSLSARRPLFMNINLYASSLKRSSRRVASFRFPQAHFLL